MKRNLREVLTVVALAVLCATTGAATDNGTDGSSPTAMRCMKTEGGLFVCTAP